MTNLRFKDAPQMHVVFEGCFNVIVSNLVIRAPGDSPNTDGIHVADTQNIVISNTDIGTGKDHKMKKRKIIYIYMQKEKLDSVKRFNILHILFMEGDDCISIISGSQNVRATDITCGPGHGIRFYDYINILHHIHTSWSFIWINFTLLVKFLLIIFFFVALEAWELITQKLKSLMW